MLTLSRPSRLVACLLVVALLGAWSWSAPLASAHPAATGPDEWRFQLLPGAQDPDDDDDGIADEHDPAPNDPTDVPPTGEEPDITSPVQDSDGDGLPNVQDPDDDNGGVADQDDPAPFDPVIEPTPPSSPTSPIHDDDGDGIPNVQDPDDDNDGTTDDADPGAPDAGPVDPEIGGPATVGENVAVGGGGVGETAPVVTALPSTGSGQGASSTAFLALLVASVALLGSVLVYVGREKNIA